MRIAKKSKFDQDRIEVCKEEIEGESNENFNSVIKIRNTTQLSCKLTTMILMI